MWGGNEKGVKNQWVMWRGIVGNGSWILGGNQLSGGIWESWRGRKSVEWWGKWVAVVINGIDRIR